VRGRVFSAITGIVSAAQILSLALGGVLLTSFAPRTIVIVGAVAGLATLAVTIRPLLSLSGPIEAEASPTSTATSPSPVP
jgi:MFS family permease